MKHSEALKAAKAVIANPENWTQGWYYKYKNGTSCKRYEDAECFCSLGALRKVNDCYDDYYLNGTLYLDLALETLNVKAGSVFIFNDTHSHAEVMALFDKAIELAEKEGE